MKKLPIFFLAAGMFAFVSCDSQTSTTNNTDGTVIDTDTVNTEYEVERTVVETDTTTETTTIDTEDNMNNR